MHAHTCAPPPAFFSPPPSSSSVLGSRRLSLVSSRRGRGGGIAHASVVCRFPHPRPPAKLSLLSANFTTCAKLKALMRKRRLPLVSPLRSSLLSFHSVVCNLDLVSFPLFSSDLLRPLLLCWSLLVCVCLRGSEREFVYDWERQTEGFRRSRRPWMRKSAIVMNLWRPVMVDSWLCFSFVTQLFKLSCLSQSNSNAHFSCLHCLKFRLQVNQLKPTAFKCSPCGPVG